MCKWNYLRFNKFGDPIPESTMPKDGAITWGFCGEDHKVMLCFKEPGYGLAFLTPFGLDEDAYIIAWAKITEVPTWPDFEKLKRCRTLKPPVGSLEWNQAKLAKLRRAYHKDGSSISKAEAKRRQISIKSFQERIDALKLNFVLENGYHLPQMPRRMRERVKFAIPISPT